MAFKFIILATVLAYANAGLLAPAVATYSAAPAVSSSYIHQASPIAVAHAGPVYSTYSAAPVAVHAPSIGASHQSVERSLGGAQSVSHYSKAVDSAFSSVRKFDTRITNDALSLAHGPVVSAYSSPLVTKTLAPAYGYSAAPAVSTSYIQQASAPVYSAYSAPVATYAAHSPAITTYSSPLYAKAVAPVATYAHAAPVAYSAGPVVTKSAVAYSPASVVAHTTFNGLGAAYQW